MNTNLKATRSYRVLTEEERVEIMIGLRMKKSLRQIAKELGRNVSVISREIKNNRTSYGAYQSTWAKNRSADRRKQCRIRERIGDYEIRAYIEQKLKLGWSPEQVAGRLPLEIPGKTISYETIYQFIFKVRRDLTGYLQCGRKKRRKRKNKRTKRVMIPGRTGIEHRPEQINNRSEYGHWEGDTAVSRESKACLMVLEERSLGLTLLRKLPRCGPEEMASAVIDRLKELPSQMVKSITFDNGIENKYHESVKKALGIQTFFCDPYSSWQKGSVENAVGLTRRVWPKKTNYELISESEIDKVEYLLNTRPRKRFSFLSPLEYAATVALSP